MSTSREAEICRLLGVGAGAAIEPDGSALLRRIPETARELTGAQFAALGIFNQRRDGLESFLTAGLADGSHHAIGRLPRGRGVLGAIVEGRRPLRLDEVARDPASYGFPGSHPVMRTFLGAPVLVGAEVRGSLYMAEKDDGGFTEADEEAAVLLAEWAAIAIDRPRTPRHEAPVTSRPPTPSPAP